MVSRAPEERQGNRGGRREVLDAFIVPLRPKSAEAQ